MKIQFEDLPIRVMGVDVGLFAGEANYDDDGSLEDVWLWSATSTGMARIECDHPLWAWIEPALSRTYADQIDEWIAGRRERARIEHDELNYRMARGA